MDISEIVLLLSGIALFLFGMSLMGDGLKKIAGNRLEVLLYKLTNTVWKGILLGTGVTAVIQSSSATSVMVVGFVNSGMMKFKQAIGIILGAILGTSITGWIICLSDLGGGSSDWMSLFSITTITGIAAVVGIFLRMFCKKPSQNHIGDILLGFAVLMFGMSTMASAVEPLKDSEGFIRLLTVFSNPLLCVLVGVLFACVLQSASAAVGILQALAITGAIDFSMAFPLIMGIAIGAAVPVLLSAIGASTDGKRTAFVYLFITVIGVIVCGGAFYISDIFIDFPFKARIMSAVSIAFINTAFRFVNVLILYPFVGLLEKLTNRLIKDRTLPDDEQPDVPMHLEDRFLPYPSVAISQCREYINTMALSTQKSFRRAVEVLHAYNKDTVYKIERAEARADEYEDGIGTYLLKINTNELNTAENNEVSKFLHTLSDFERISDHTLSIALLGQQSYQSGFTFSPEAEQELAVIENAVAEMLSITVNAFINDNLPLAEQAEPLEAVIDNLCDELKFHHVERLKNGECELEHSFIFNDLLTGYERISDHCSNIAAAVIEAQHGAFDTHHYLRMVKDASDGEFARQFDAYSARFSLETAPQAETVQKT